MLQDLCAEMLYGKDTLNPEKKVENVLVSEIMLSIWLAMFTFVEQKTGIGVDLKSHPIAIIFNISMTLM